MATGQSEYLKYVSIMLGVQCVTPSLEAKKHKWSVINLNFLLLVNIVTYNVENDFTSKIADATSFTRAHVRFGLVSGPIFLEHLSCSGNENNILECPRGVLGLHQCDHTNLAGVQCYGIIILYLQ